MPANLSDARFLGRAAYLELSRLFSLDMTGAKETGVNLLVERATIYLYGGGIYFAASPVSIAIEFFSAEILPPETLTKTLPYLG